VTTVACTIGGDPRAPDPQRRGLFSPWREAAVADIERARAGRHTLTGPVKVELVFRFQVPHTRAQWWQRPGAPHITKPWLEQLDRAVIGALVEAGVIKEPAQVALIDSTKHYARDGESPGALVIVSSLEGPR
jgi:Holliday junction resolvase RusA-like endonuclease